MNQPTQFRMEILRQSGKKAAGMVPVNQKNFLPLFEGTMDAQDFGWYIIVPEKETLSCLGLTEKYAGFTAVESVLETPGCTTVILRSAGTVTWLSKRKYQCVKWNGEDITGQVEKNGTVFTVKQKETCEKAVLCVRW